MKIHVLPGDALVEKFSETNIEGEVVVCRECLVDGDVKAASFEDFWEVRANFIAGVYGESKDSYRKNVASEFEKLQNAPENSEVNLWFEYELFCQVNLWFCLWLLSDKNIEIYRVAPVIRSENEIWKGFGGLGGQELKECFSRRVKFSQTDVQLGKRLWKAFCFDDVRELQRLSAAETQCFPKLKEVCEAATEIKSRPKETLRKILSESETDFTEIFRRFGEVEGVYGFGDSQVKRILREIQPIIH